MKNMVLTLKKMVFHVRNDTNSSELEEMKFELPYFYEKLGSQAYKRILPCLTFISGL